MLWLYEYDLMKGLNLRPSINILFLIFPLLIALLLFPNSAKGKEVKAETEKKEKVGADKQETPPKIGNFSLPSSQQPGSLLAFGENIYDKGTILSNLHSNYAKGSKMYSTVLLPNIIYCLTDSSSILLSIPYFVKNKFEHFSSKGIGDIALQFEHAFYQKTNSCYEDQLTFVLNTTFPTGSARKEPSTGFGAQTYSFGVTFLRYYTDWLLFSSDGTTITTSRHGTKFGNELIYEFGFGRNIAYETDKWLLNWALEFDGLYVGKDKINGVKDPNSGGNIILITPSLWFSTRHLIIQVGIAKYLVQHLFGVQKKEHYQLIGNIAWTF